MMNVLDALAHSIQSADHRDGRIYAPQYGVVTDASDPQNLGRVRIRMGSMATNESTDWAMPMWGGAGEEIPRVGDPAFVLFVDGDVNRPIYCITATTKTQNRAQDFALLATTFIGMYNDLATKFNTLKSTFNSHVHLGASTVCANGGPWTGSTNPPTTTDSDANVGVGLAADGSQPSQNASNTIVLSGHAKVRQ